MTTHEVLVKARNLIEREGWAQERASGWWCERPGNSRCAHNALMETSYKSIRDRSLYLSALRSLQAVLGVATNSELYEWNDAPGRTKEEVLAAFDRAIANTAPPPADPFDHMDYSAEAVAMP